MDEAANIPAKTVNSFKDCIRGTTKTTLIDLCTITPTRSVVTLNARIYSLTKSVLGDDALGNQLTYVRRIPKPRQLSIEDWIRRICEINNLINYFTLPASEAWLQTIAPTALRGHGHKGHEWADCRQNPRNRSNNSNNNSNYATRSNGSNPSRSSNSSCNNHSHSRRPEKNHDWSSGNRDRTRSSSRGRSRNTRHNRSSRRNRSISISYSSSSADGSSYDSRSHSSEHFRNRSRRIQTIRYTYKGSRDTHHSPSHGHSSQENTSRFIWALSSPSLPPDETSPTSSTYSKNRKVHITAHL